MALREKLGRLVLIEETEAGSLGTEYRAARLSPTGLDRLVAVLRFSPAVSAHAEATRRLMEEARVVARLHGPGLVRVLGIGRADQSFYVSTELVEGRSLAAIFERCRREAFPLAADQALMIASRAASALEYVHGKKDEGGRRLFHGLLTPSRLIVTYDGEVKIKGLGLWTALVGTDLLGPEDRLRLAPEQASGGEGDLASDVHALGLVLLEALTGVPPDGRDPVLHIADARVTSTTGERSPLPRPLAELLRRALAREPSARFPGMAELRKAIDALLFSGDFTPTTFDVAFFMHTLFRDEMAHEAAALEEARRADYREFVAEEGAAAGTAEVSEKGASTEPVAPAAWTSPAFEPQTPAAVAQPTPAAAVSPTPATAVPRVDVERPTAPAPVVDAFAPTLVGRDRRTEPEPSAPAVEPPPPEVLPAPSPRTQRDAAREAASRLTFGRPAPSPRERRLLWLVVGVLAAVGVGGTAGGVYFVKFRSATTTPAAALSPEAVAAQARVRELEARVSELEREKADAENQAAEKARIDLEAKAAAGGRATDPATVAAAQELARRRAREELQAKQQAELARLAEARKAEEERLAAEAARQSTPAPPPSTTPATSATPAPTPSSPTLMSPSTVPAPTDTPAPTPSPSTLPPSSTAIAGLTPATPTPAPSPLTSPSSGAPAPAPTGSQPAAQGAPAESRASSRTPVSPGALVDVNDPELTPPVVVAQTPARYPPVAMQRLIEGTVELRILVDERGVVREVTVVRASPRGAGFEDAAVSHARTRRYRPATVGSVPVRVWLPVVVNFRNPKG